MIIFLYGPDTFRSRQKLQELKSKYLQKIEHGEYNLLKIDGENIGLKDVQEALSVPPLLAKKRMIVFENILKKANKKITHALLDFFKHKKTEDIIIFWEGDLKKITDPLLVFLKKEKYTQEFDLPRAPQFKAWIQEQFEKLELSINEPSLGLLQSTVGLDLWQMNQEIEKIASYLKAKNKTKVSKDIIQLLVQGNIEKNIFSLLDALSAKNFPLFVKLLENQLSTGNSEVYLIASIAGLFRNLIQIKDLLKQEPSLNFKEVASRLRIHPFVVQKTRTSLVNFTLDELKEIYQALLQADIRLKSIRVLKPRLFIDLVVAKIRESTA